MKTTKEEAIRRKKVMLAAGISVPNTDGSWGSWWESLWKKANTHQKSYEDSSFPAFLGYLYDKVTGNTTYEAEPQPRGGIITASNSNLSKKRESNENYWHPILGAGLRFKTSMLNGTNPLIGFNRTVVPAVEGASLVTGVGSLGKGVVLLGKTIIPAIPRLFTKPVATKAVLTVIRETPRIAGSIIGAKAVDVGSELATDNTVAENVSNHLLNLYHINVPTYITEWINPGYVGGYKLMDRAIRRASFNLITPIGYHDGMLPLTKFLEGVEIIKDIPKLIFNFRDINVPKWRLRFEAQPGYNPSDLNLAPMTNEDFLNNRESALRLVFGIKPKEHLYNLNPDGTYSYDLDYLYTLGSEALTLKGFGPDKRALYSYKPAYDPSMGSYGDNLGFNGGYINYSENNGVSTISDVYDVLPFKDDYRLPSFKGAEFLHKYLPDLEVFNALGGKPFTLRLSIQTTK